MKVTRHVGAGDVEHVRNQMLNVCLASSNNLEMQVKGICIAARKLNLRARIHFQGNDEDANFLAQKFFLPFEDFSIHAYADDFKSKKESEMPEMIIDEVETELASDIAKEILEVWNRLGGRFAGGNFGKLTAEQLKEKYL
jgi:hypothetical protein